MKKINLTPNIILSHLKYCRGIFNKDIHTGMHKVKSASDKKFYLKKRPYGKLLKYGELNYPEVYSKKNEIKLNLKYETRKKIVEYLISKFNKIIIGKPSELLELEINLYGLLEKEEDKLTLNNFLEFIFDYESFSQEEYENSEWNAYKYIQSLDVSICLYCNAQFTHVIYKYSKTSNTFKIRPALDHVYPKTNHPLLAVSLFNLVPCCNTCNSGLKSSDEIELRNLVHPYIQGINDIGVFTRNFNENENDGCITQDEDKVEDYYSKIVGRDLDYDIEFIARKAKDVEKVSKYEKMFGINHRYELHKQYLNKQISLALIYNEVYLNRLDIGYENIAFESSLLKEVLFETDINNSILSKLISDTLNEIRKAEQFYTIEEKKKIRSYLKE